MQAQVEGVTLAQKVLRASLPTPSTLDLLSFRSSTTTLINTIIQRQDAAEDGEPRNEDNYYRPTGARLRVSTLLSFIIHIVTSTGDLDEFVTFLIGKSNPNKFQDNPKKFLVHKSFVCYHSPVLKAAFNSKFEEGETQTYKLADVTVPVFWLFVKWLYTQNLEELKTPKDHDNALIRLWILAEKFFIPRLQKNVIDALEQFRKPTKTLTSNEFVYVYENTSVDSPLRKLLVHQCVWNLAHTAFKNSSSQFPQEMLIGIATASRLVVMSKGGIPPMVIPTFYVKE